MRSLTCDFAARQNFPKILNVLQALFSHLGYFRLRTDADSTVLCIAVLLTISCEEPFDRTEVFPSLPSSSPLPSITPLAT